LLKVWLNKLWHWRGFSAIYGLKAATVLEFVDIVRAALWQSDAKYARPIAALSILRK
jgi:hypothetical protein